MSQYKTNNIINKFYTCRQQFVSKYGIKPNVIYLDKYNYLDIQNYCYSLDFNGHVKRMFNDCEVKAVDTYRDHVSVGLELELEEM